MLSKEYRKVAISTLGCRLNQFESDSLKSSFIKNGYSIVPFSDKADAYIINGCTVTGKSDAKTRNQINRVNRTNPFAKLFITGCYAEVNKDILSKINKDNYFIIPNGKKYETFNIVDEILDNRAVDLELIEDNKFSYFLGENTLRTRNYLKIQDGCNDNCSYCKVPMARGRAESRPALDIFNDIEKMLSFGFKEIILTGINIGDYHSKDGYTLYTLLKRIVSINANFRVHLSSIEPNKLSFQIINLLIASKKLCNHFHIPLQSGSNKILRSMKRNYTKEEYFALLEYIRKQDEDINITTDLMLGFPGESEDDFIETYSFIKSIKPSHIHTFKYSVREGTEAINYPNQVPEHIKSKRSAQIRDLSSRLNFKYRKRFLNKKFSIIPEKEIKKDVYTGYTDYYIRVNYLDNRGDDLKGFKTVMINHVDYNETLGSLSL